MGAVIWIAIWAACALCALDAARRPTSAWAHADRQKGWWVSMLIVSAVFALAAPVMVPAYLIGVVPRFPSSVSAQGRYAK